MTRALSLIRAAAARLGAMLWADGDMSAVSLHIAGGLSFAALLARVGIGA